MKTLHLLQTFRKVFYIHKSLVSYLEGIRGKRRLSGLAREQNGRKDGWGVRRSKKRDPTVTRNSQKS